MKLSLTNVTKKFDNKAVVDQVSLNLENVHVLGIIGPSGGGKSTLLRMIAGIEPITSGDILVNDINVKKEVEKLHKKTGFVFQTHNLFLHLSVLDNITIVLEKVHGVSNQEARERAMGLLNKFGLAEHLRKKPHQLSGGQSQRVSIVRSLAINPDMLLFDEPTSALDPILTYEVLETILKLKEEKKDFMIVTHEIGFAKEVADYILFLQDGKIVEHGDVSIINNPKTKELKGFLSKVFSWQ
ncbi:amino acid ABC transporter ATP-binding protein [Vallitalea okinawensis]|uniref:amino acid ABC transporter ATP-binding protein n=1 Tax=Vallitalea okinawensis TaxID=2078660 RepID=UPI000CFB748E|nr:amino acid ABC transporter ATP-binding protein [Vallitalea okinawensis]